MEDKKCIGFGYPIFKSEVCDSFMCITCAEITPWEESRLITFG